MEKEQLLELIKNKSERVTFERSSGTSTVWEQFLIVKVDNEVFGFVQCNLCKQLLKWKSRDGTSGLSYHISSCKPCASNNKKIADLPGFSKASVSVPASAKSDTADVIVRMCATDIR